MNKFDFISERDKLNSEYPKIKFGEKPTESQKETIDRISSSLKALRQSYIESNTKIPIGSKVDIKLNSGRVLKGVMLIEYGIYYDLSVGPLTYKSGSKLKYITIPIQSMKISQQ